MESTQHYLINMMDGRVILYTKQAARQINYHPITEAVALAVGSGEIAWQDVVSRIKANLINNQDAWDDLLKRKTTMNVRKSTLTPGDSEGMETAPEGEDVQNEFDMDGEAPAGAAPAAPAKEASRRKPGKKAAAEPAPAAEAPAEPAAEAAPAAPDGEDLDL